jgi:hypothetical protein
MRRYLVPSLLAANAALAVLLVWLWVTPQGELRSVRWTPPAPVKPVLDGPSAPAWSADLGSFMASLDRPLFSPTRKPPPKPDAAIAVAVDTLDDVRILGVYSGAGGGGAIVRADGKVRRVRPGDSVGGWSVKEVRPSELLMARGEEERSLNVKLGPDLGPDVPSAGGGSSGSRPDLTQRREREANESTARVNAMRARAGLPPLP